jgi:putative ABC transport system permease protein
MGRLALWLRWSSRDLRSRWALVLAIGLVIAIGTGVSSGLGSLENWRVASNDASFAALHAHDVEVSLTEGTDAPAGSLQALSGSIPAKRQVARVTERLILPTQVEVRRAGAESLLTPGEIVGAPLAGAGPRIDGFYADSGRVLRSADEGRSVAVLERNFAAYHHLPAEGSLRLPGGKRLRYVGLGGSPEYFLVTRPGGGEFGGAEAQFAVLFTSLSTAQRTAGGGRVVNNAVLRLHDGGNPDRVRNQLEDALDAAGLSGEVTTLAEEPAHRILYKDAEGDQRLLDIFALLILAGAALAAFNLATRIVEAERREIGVGMALGVPPRELAIRPLLLGAQIALAGTLFGLILGLFMGSIFRDVLKDLLPLPEMRTPFEPAVFVRAALLGLLFPILATAIPVWRGLRLSPVEAIRVGFRSARSSGIAALGSRLRLPGSTIAQLPLRNVLRAPRRTLLTALGIGAVLSVLVAFTGLIDSFVATVDRSEAEVAQENPRRLTVTLDGFRRSGAAVQAIERTPGVAAAEPQLALPVKLSAPDTAGFDASLTVLDFSSPIWAPTIESGEAPPPRRPYLVISEEAAHDLGVGVGDSVTLTYPSRQGNRFVDIEAPVRVSGLHPNPFRIFAYANRSAAAAAGMVGMTNQVAVTPKARAGEAMIRRALFGIAAVASVERATATTNFVRDRLDDFIGILRLIEGFALALVLLIAFNSSSIGIDERQRENATMLGFGVPVAGAVGLAVAESVIVGALGTLVGLAGGFLVVGWVANETLPETLPDLGLVTYISAGSLLVAAAVALLAVAVAPLLSSGRIRRMDIPSTLRVME